MEAGLKYIEYAFKILQLVGILLIAGMFVEKSNTTAARAEALDERVTVVEKRQVEWATITQQTVTTLAEVQRQQRAHEIEDSAVTAEVKALARELEHLK